MKFILTDEDGYVYDGEIDLKRTNNPKLNTHTVPKHSVVINGEANIGDTFKFPDWFYNSEPTMLHAVAILLYELKVPLSSGQIAKIISKAWKDVDLRNISKLLTTRGKWLYVYVQKDIERRHKLNDKGRVWVEKDVIPLYTSNS